MRRALILAALLAGAASAQQCPITINGACAGPDGTPYATMSNVATQGLMDPSIVVTPATGNTVTMDGTASLLIVNSGLTLGTLNVVLPASPRDGQRVVITTTNAITVISGSAGATPVKGALATLAANGWARYAYSATVGAWVRTG